MSLCLITYQVSLVFFFVFWGRLGYTYFSFELKALKTIAWIFIGYLIPFLNIFVTLYYAIFLFERCKFKKEYIIKHRI